MNAVVRFCAPRFSPQGFWVQVPPASVQDDLRQAFQGWGLPLRFRVDNGAPWGSAGDLPTELALWLIGLGLEVMWNTPHRPEENGIVERSQGTGKRWSEPHTCSSIEELQKRVAMMDQIQREEYPSLAGSTRSQAFPQLAQPLRPYSRTWEKKHWRLAAVATHLAGYAVPRQVDKSGKISLYNRSHYVGVLHQGKTVHVMFDPDCYEWVIADLDGRQLRRKPAEEITRERIQTLTVSRRRP
jgi:hypothetical protein